MGATGIIDFSNLLPVKKRGKRIVDYKVLENILQKLTQNACQLKRKKEKKREENAHLLSRQTEDVKVRLDECDSQSQTEYFKAPQESTISENYCFEVSFNCKYENLRKYSTCQVAVS